MQILFFSAFALILSAVSASTLSARQQAPSCALQCLVTVPTSPCSATNNTCLCSDETFLRAQLTCFMQACTSASDFAAAQEFVDGICQQVGVDLTTDTNLIPDPTSAPSGGMGGSVSTSASSSSSTTTVPTVSSATVSSTTLSSTTKSPTTVSSTTVSSTTESSTTESSTTPPSAIPPSTTPPSTTAPAPSTSQTSGALLLDLRAAGALFLTVTGIALTL